MGRLKQKQVQILRPKFKSQNMHISTLLWKNITPASSSSQPQFQTQPMSLYLRRSRTGGVWALKISVLPLRVDFSEQVNVCRSTNPKDTFNCLDIFTRNYNFLPNSDIGLEVLISWLRGGMRGQPKQAFPCLISVGCDPRQTRLQNHTVWLEWLGRQGSIGVFLQLKEGRQPENRIKHARVTYSAFTPACILACLFFFFFGIPRPPLTAFPTTQVLTSH